MIFMKNDDQIAQVLATLNDSSTIRLRSQAMFDWVMQGGSEYFIIDLEQMTHTASFVLEVIEDNYPDLNIPFHSRWRHFEAGGINRIKKMQEQLITLSPEEQGKIFYELVIISVFLDAGAGPYWHFKEQETGITYSRSEGLALATLSLYQKGFFSSDPSEPLRVDAERLLILNEKDLHQGFQISASNPLEGISGRIRLLNQLGSLIKHDVQHFGQERRLGNFYSFITSLITHNNLAVTDIFQAVLNTFNRVWPTRLLFHGIPLGDVWQHKALKTDTLGSEYIPFHKLSQWLTYSLIEPLTETRVSVTHLEGLTGLPEYRNGGLFIDCGVLSLKNKTILDQPHSPGEEVIVEWRALTIVLLDELAQLIRKKLNKHVEELPLTKILQGGTWEAGRKIAKQKRPQGTPPLQVISDGTLF